MKDAIDPAQFQKLKARVEKARRAYDQAQGAMERIRSQCQAEFGISLLEDITEKLGQMKKKLEKLERELTAEWDEKAKECPQMFEDSDE